MQFLNIRILMTTSLLLVLSACGGGGGGSSDDTNNSNSGSAGVYDVAITSLTGPVTANAGDTISIDLTVANQGDILASPTVLVNLSTDNTYEVFDTFMGLSSQILTISAGTSIDNTIMVDLPDNLRSGTYYIVGHHPSNPDYPDADQADNTSAYAITVTGTSCTPDLHEENDTSLTATTLILNTPLSHNHCEDTDDWHVFTAVQGTTYQIDATAIGTNASMQLELYDPSVSLTEAIDADALNGSGNDAQIIWQATSSGQFYVRAAGFFNLVSSGANTEYQLNLSTP